MPPLLWQIGVGDGCLQLHLTSVAVRSYGSSEQNGLSWVLGSIEIRRHALGHDSGFETETYLLD
jgi:hypothetical protein